MKGLIIASSVILGIIIGLIPSLIKEKPNWWKYLIGILFVANLVLILTPVLVSDHSYANYVAQTGIEEQITIELNNHSINPANDTITIASINYPIINFSKFDLSQIKLINIEFNKQNQSFSITGTKDYSIIPISYPLILELKERIKIMVLHVPTAWVSVLAYLLSMIYSIMYLRKRDYKYDIYAHSAAGVGVMFTILATVTGMIWAKFNWGAYWNWDPRQTSIFMLLIIYFAYFGLRSSIENSETRARLSSVYLIIAFTTVPFFVFILPRISSGLHPGAAGEGTAGPVLGGGAEMLNHNLLFTFGFSLFCFTLLFFWILNLKIRTELLNKKW